MKLHKTKLFLIVILLFSFSKISFAETTITGTALLDVSKSRTFVPIRFVTEQLGAEVTWNGEDRTVLIENKSNIVRLKIGNKQVEVNSTFKTIDAPPFIDNDITYVPLRFVSTILGGEPTWDAKTATVNIEMDKKIITLSTVKYYPKSSTTVSKSNENPITVATKSFKVGTKTIKANVVTIDLTDPSIDLKIGLAQDLVGQVEDLDEIVKRNEATVGINGTFFDAYSEIKEPYGMIIADGKIVHIGQKRTVFSFDSKNNTAFRIMNPEIKGSTNGSNEWPNNWYAYWINRTPQYNAGESVIIFTQERGESIGFNYGTNIIVENGKVREIVEEKDVKIPKNGFVINLMGTEVHNLLDRFTIGTSVSYKVINDGVNFGNIDGAIGAGPRLLKDGKIAVDFDLEGFKEEKIKTGSAARSAIGVTKEKKLIMLTTTATIVELAEIMKQAGAMNAMNLDGGASSGLYYNGSYITTPGRKISNAILVIKK